MEQLQRIESKIYEIRGKRVMLDRDLAELYQVTTSNLNKAVKRNIERFPERYMFQLTKDEFLKFQNGILNDNDAENLIFQNGTSSWGGTRKLPFVFTEQGVSMLSAVLRSEVAVNVSISIMDAFVAMREYITNTNLQSSEIRELRARIEALEVGSEETLGAVNDLSEDTRKNVDNIYNAIAELSIKLPVLDEPRRPIGFNIDRKKK